MDLSEEKFKIDLSSKETEESLNEEINRSKELFAESFPSLVLQLGSEFFSIPIDYDDSKKILDEINYRITG